MLLTRPFLLSLLGYALAQHTGTTTELSLPSLMLPQDIYFDPEIRKAIHHLRETGEYLQILSTAANQDFVTLTLTGYKGGELKDQINQDRSFIDRWSNNDFALGVFDGHGHTGHGVADFCRAKMIQFLKERLQGREKLDDDQVQKILIESFEEVDRLIPHEMAMQGGATATVVVRMGNTIHFANTGDSMSVLVAYIKGRTVILHENRLDKPNDAEERQRILDAGGSIEAEGSEPYHWVAFDNDGYEHYLAMTRSLGDRAATLVISTPTVYSYDLSAMRLVAFEQFKRLFCRKGNEVECKEIHESDIQFFAASASDGIIDYIHGDAYADTLANGLYSDQEHVILAVEDIFVESSKLWHGDFGAHYRDDMAISIAKILL